MNIELYTKPSCMQCAATEWRLDKHGISYSKHTLANHPDVVADLRARGFMAAPGVILRASDGGILDAWGGNNTAKIDAAVDRIRQADAVAYLLADEADNVEQLEDHR
ncbi:glutaredoxin domain-containing protein [Actinomyces radicidentis]|uniref:glutaredoxin domain-containing protein n=1 Tax=Actinomyces radicidentis TaxID=111015 RepID=UPI0028EF614B|nr:glutaredoxin domain-containing protein [Actinomyces radicidentis]